MFRNTSRLEPITGFQYDVQATAWTIRASNRMAKILLLPKTLFCLMSTTVSLSETKRPGCELTIDLHVTPKLRTSRVILQHPLYTFMACIGTSLHLLHTHIVNLIVNWLSNTRNKSQCKKKFLPFKLSYDVLIFDNLSAGSGHCQNVICYPANSNHIRAAHKNAGT